MLIRRCSGKFILHPVDGHSAGFKISIIRLLLSSLHYLLVRFSVSKPVWDNSLFNLASSCSIKFQIPKSRVQLNKFKRKIIFCSVMNLQQEL